MSALTFNQALEAETVKRIDEAVQNSKNTLAAGQLPDHATYRYHAGVIKGMEDAKEILQATLRDIQRV